MYLKEAKNTKGMWHKQVISRMQDYMRDTPEPELISAINTLQDATLIPFLWEAGLSQKLQDVANKRSLKLAPSNTEVKR